MTLTNETEKEVKAEYQPEINEETIKVEQSEEVSKPIDENLEPEVIVENFPQEEVKDTKAVWHSLAGAFVVKNEYNIFDEEILSAICFHSTGKENMSTLDKVLFVADFIEDTRGGDWVNDAVKASFIDLDMTVKIILNQKVDFLTKSGKIICELTLRALKYYS